MRNRILVGLMLACAIPALLGAQSQPSPPPAPAASTASPTPAASGAAEQPSLTTVTGCIVRSDQDRFTLADVKGGKYELKGANLKPFVGKRVQVSGSSRRLVIVGGLYPSPNIAAQAGAIDPVQAATAAMPGGAAHGTGTEPLPELQIKTMRTVKGTCP